MMNRWKEVSVIKLCPSAILRIIKRKENQQDTTGRELDINTVWW